MCSRQCMCMCKINNNNIIIAILLSQPLYYNTEDANFMLCIENRKCGEINYKSATLIKQIN